MKAFFLLLTVQLCTTGYAQKDYTIHDLKAGKFKEDNSFVYSLPYEKGTKHLLAQAYDSKFSHKGEYALDFKMKEGTKVCAARAGTVVSLRADSQKGGLKPEFLSEGNYIIIQHEDGSYGNYWHLRYNGALVAIGDTIKQGQVIGLSGNTGYTAFPHLHFEVTTAPVVSSQQVPTRFKTKKGVKYLRPAKWYKAV
jgi:murein DD-endopeptidase MepM/ murein hydrolase activator NlpD